MNSIFKEIMVSKVEEAMKRNRLQQRQKQVQYKKGKVGKFKRSSSIPEEDGASSAILLLACIACAPCFLIMHALANSL